MAQEQKPKSKTRGGKHPPPPSVLIGLRGKMMQPKICSHLNWQRSTDNLKPINIHLIQFQVRQLATHKYQNINLQIANCNFPIINSQMSNDKLATDRNQLTNDRYQPTANRNQLTTSNSQPATDRCQSTSRNWQVSISHLLHDYKLDQHLTQLVLQLDLVLPLKEVKIVF